MESLDAAKTKLLRSKIRKADEGRSDIENDLLLLERRVGDQLLHGSGVEDRAENIDELGKARRGIANLADLEAQVCELSQTAWGPDFYARRRPGWSF
jgi:hypothetical protein